MGANIGKMMADIFRLRSAEARHSLLATGAVAGQYGLMMLLFIFFVRVVTTVL